jgi:hypothetical protein
VVEVEERAPFQIEWADPEQTILLVTLPEVWTPDGFLASFTRINQLEHERSGHSIWVAARASLFVSRLTEIYKRVFGFEIPIAYSLDAAYEYIADHPL